jgi:hypothetical protein
MFTTIAALAMMVTLIFANLASIVVSHVAAMSTG